MFKGGEHLKNRGIGQCLTAGRQSTEHSLEVLNSLQIFFYTLNI